MTQPSKQIRPIDADSARRNKTTESVSPLSIDKTQLQKYQNKLNGRDRSITQRSNPKQNQLQKVKSHRVVNDYSHHQKHSEANLESLKSQLQKKIEIIEKQREYIRLIDQELWVYKKSTLYQKDEEIQRKNSLIEELQVNEQLMLQQIQELQNRIDKSFQMKTINTYKQDDSLQEKELKKKLKQQQREIDQQKFLIQKVQQLCGQQDQEMNLNDLILKFDERKSQIQLLELKSKEFEQKAESVKRKKVELKHKLELEQQLKQKQEQELLELRSQVEKLLKSKEKLGKQLSEVNHKIQETVVIANEVSQLKEVNQDYEKKVTELRLMLTDLQQFSQDLKLKLTKKDQELIVEKQKKQSISSKQSLLEMEVTRYKHEISDFKLELQLEQQQRQKFEKDALDQAQQVEKLLKSKAKLTQQIVELNKQIDGVNQLVREIAYLKEQKNDDERKIQDLINKLQELQHLGQDLQQKLQRKDQEINVEKTRKQSLNLKQTYLETEIARLKHELAEQEKVFKKDFAQIQKERDEFSHQAKETKKAKEKLSADNEHKVHDLKLEISSLQKELKEQKQKNDEQHDYILRLQSENKKLQTELSDLRRSSEEQVEKLKHKLEDSQKDSHKSNFNLSNSLVAQSQGGDAMDQSVSLFLKKMTQMKDKLGKNTKNLEEFGRKFGLHLNNVRNQKQSDTSDKEVVDEFNDLLKEICQQIDSMNEMQRQIVGDLEKRLLKEGEKQRSLVQQNMQLKLENHKIEELTNLNKELQTTLDSIKKEKQKLALDNQNLEAIARRGSVSNGTSHHGSGLQLPHQTREHRKSLYLQTSQSTSVNNSIHDKQLIDKLEREVQQLKKELQETHQIISAFQSGGNVSNDKQINYLNKRVQDLQNQLKQKAVEIENLQKEHDNYRIEMEEEIDRLENEVEERDERIQELLKEKLQGQ